MSNSVCANSEKSPEQEYLGHLRSGNLKVQNCLHCKTWIFFPRTNCLQCRSEDYVWAAPRPGGTIYTFTCIVQKAEPKERNVVLVDMDEGFRMMGTCPGLGEDDLRIGMRVRAAVETESNPPRVVFVAEAA